LIKFVSYANRHKIWSNKKLCKGHPFYLTESLTKLRINLLKKAQTAFSNNHVWTNDSRIYILLNDGTKTSIARESELDELINKIKNNREEELEGHRTRGRAYKTRNNSQK